MQHSWTVTCLTNVWKFNHVTIKWTENPTYNVKNTKSQWQSYQIRRQEKHSHHLTSRLYRHKMAAICQKHYNPQRFEREWRVATGHDLSRLMTIFSVVLISFRLYARWKRFMNTCTACGMRHTALVIHIKVHVTYPQTMLLTLMDGSMLLMKVVTWYSCVVMN